MILVPCGSVQRCGWCAGQTGLSAQAQRRRCADPGVQLNSSGWHGPDVEWWSLRQDIARVSGCSSMSYKGAFIMISAYIAAAHWHCSGGHRGQCSQVREFHHTAPRAVHSARLLELAPRQSRTCCGEQERREFNRGQRPSHGQKKQELHVCFPVAACFICFCRFVVFT